MLLEIQLLRDLTLPQGAANERQAAQRWQNFQGDNLLPNSEAGPLLACVTQVQFACTHAGPAFTVSALLPRRHSIRPLAVLSSSSSISASRKETGKEKRKVTPTLAVSSLRVSWFIVSLLVCLGLFKMFLFC